MIEAAAMASYGETYVLDMGTPIRILDLVERYLRLSGKPNPGFVFTGLRPGEKLHEELLDSTESVMPTGHSQISCVRARPRVVAPASQQLGMLAALIAIGDEDEIRDQLMRLIPEANSVAVEAATSSLLALA